jgi:hypothetical protein
MKMELIVENTLDEGLKELKKKFPELKKQALMKGGLQLINWIVNGSPKNSRVPPIKTGQLRAAGSVFVGKELVDTTGKWANTSYNEKEDVTTIGFNTAYAAKLHETEWEPGPRSLQSGDVGNKYIESHLKSDAKAWLEFVGKLIKKGL